MPRPLSEMALSIKAYLSDGEWRTLDQVIAAVGDKIPAGQAYRTAEKDRTRHREIPQERLSVDYPKVVAVGRRIMVGDWLRQACREGRLVRRKVAGTTQYRDDRADWLSGKEAAAVLGVNNTVIGVVLAMYRDIVQSRMPDGESALIERNRVIRVPKTAIPVWQDVLAEHNGTGKGMAQGAARRFFTAVHDAVGGSYMESNEIARKILEEMHQRNLVVRHNPRLGNKKGPTSNRSAATPTGRKSAESVEEREGT